MTFSLPATSWGVLGSAPGGPDPGRLARLKELLSKAKNNPVARAVLVIYAGYRLVNEGQLPGRPGVVQTGNPDLREPVRDALDDVLGSIGLSAGGRASLIRWLDSTGEQPYPGDAAAIIVWLAPLWFTDP